MNFETVTIIDTGPVARIELGRPDKANALNAKMWKELKDAFDWLSLTSHVRVGVISAQGNHFTAGIDLEFLMAIKSELAHLPEGRRQERLREFIVGLQETVNAIEVCRKPVLAAIHGACIGAGIDLVTACDMRYATQDARFSVKEVDFAIVADVGTLQRLPRIIGEGRTRELAYTGREFDAQEAQLMGLVNQVFAERNSLLAGIMDLAASIARKSPLAIRGIKESLNYSRDHTVAEGLNFVATRNAATLFSSDFEEVVAAKMQKRTAKFED